MDLVFSAPAELITISPMSQIAEARAETEDWTGVTSSKERRKLQNRLNKRAQRRKQKLLAAEEWTELEIPGTLEPEISNAGTSSTDDTSAVDTLTVTMGQLALVPVEEYEMKRMASPPKPYLVKVRGAASTDDTCLKLSQAARESYIRYIQGAPSHGHLTTVVHFNVFHGLARNAALLGMKDQWLKKGTRSAFNQQEPSRDQQVGRWPANMHPTALQRTVRHHPWIDLFPLPRMRDNFLRATAGDEVLRHRGTSTVNEDGLCRDIVDVGAGHGVERAALVVWGDAWDPSAWEATEMFLRKWGWVLEGCTEVLEATNYWRKKRGLKPFKFEAAK